MTTLCVELGKDSYNIYVGRGLLGSVSELINTKRRIFILTDSGVPAEYAEAVASGIDTARIFTVPMGEGSKSLATLEEVLTAMADFEMTRADALIAVGGGVVGDLGGFAAACYMRGIDFYNIPTTVLADVDSSIGGKTAVNLGGIKNIVGAFHQPRGVIIDTECLKTLDDRQISAGLCEAVKMAVTFDEELFLKFECMSREEIIENIGEIITASLKIKKAVVEEDVREKGLRRVLNFGHTFGHCIEANEALGGLYHGECVALGMLPMCSASVRARLIPFFEKLGLPTSYVGSVDAALTYLSHDKKAVEGGVMAVLSNEVGSYEIKKMSLDEFGLIVKEVF